MKLTLISKKFIYLFLFCFCFSAYAKKKIDLVVVPKNNIHQFKLSDQNFLFNYFASNNNWMIIENGGIKCASYKIDGTYNSELINNGYYMLKKDSFNCVRLKLAVSFRHKSESSYNQFQSNLKTGKNKINFESRNGFYESYSVLTLDSINIEIYAAVKKKDATIIQNAINNVLEELNFLYKQKEEFQKSGVLNNKYFKQPNDSSFFAIKEYGKKGFYYASCSYPFSNQGKVFVKIKDKANNEWLGNKKTTPYTIKQVAFHPTERVNYNYEITFLLNDGSYSKPIEAEVEFYFLPQTGEAFKIGSTSATLYRFMRDKR